MTYTDMAIEALGVAEATLRDIIARALSAKAYRDLSKVAGAADAVAALTRELAGIGDMVAQDASLALDTSSGMSTSAIQIQTTVQAPNASRALTRRLRIRDLRDGDRLVKVAWSKKERRPVRAPCTSGCHSSAFRRCPTAQG